MIVSLTDLIGFSERRQSSRSFMRRITRQKTASVTVQSCLVPDDNVNFLSPVENLI